MKNRYTLNILERLTLRKGGIAGVVGGRVVKKKTTGPTMVSLQLRPQV